MIGSRPLFFSASFAVRANFFPKIDVPEFRVELGEVVDRMVAYEFPGRARVHPIEKVIGEAVKDGEAQAFVINAAAEQLTDVAAGDERIDPFDRFFFSHFLLG